jgi:hypothetical protein
MVYKNNASIRNAMPHLKEIADTKYKIIVLQEACNFNTHNKLTIHGAFAAYLLCDLGT